jgi:hypothetical protein
VVCARWVRKDSLLVHLRFETAEWIGRFGSLLGEEVCVLRYIGLCSHNVHVGGWFEKQFWICRASELKRK